MGTQCISVMKDSRLSVRMSTRRLNKLRQYAAGKDKTVTQLIEDWIDRLPNPKTGDSDARGLALSEAMPLAKPLEEKALRCVSSTPCPVNPTD